MDCCDEDSGDGVVCGGGGGGGAGVDESGTVVASVRRTGLNEDDTGLPAD